MSSLTHKVTQKTIDDCLEILNVSYYQYRLLVICGTVFMSDAMVLILVSFVSVCAGEAFSLDNEEIASITSSLFFGELVGSFFWGPFADTHGRKSAYIYSGLSITVGSLLMVVAPNYVILLFCTFFIGFGIGGCSAAFDLLAEFMPAAERGRFLLFIEYFWTVGSLFVICLAWLVLDLFSWRVLTFLASMPVATACFFSLFYLDESPRWLLEQGRNDEAREILLSAATLNGVDLGEFCLVEQVENYGGEYKENDHQVSSDSDIVLITGAQSDIDTNVEPDAGLSCVGILTSYAQLFEPDMLSITIPLLTVWFFSAIGYYGIILFTTRLNSSEDAVDTTGEQKCSFEYSGIAENCFAELVGITLCIAVINRLGRVNTQFVGYGIGVVAAFIMGIFYRNTSLLFICAFFARAACMGSVCSTWVGTAETLPTRVRASGHSMCVCFSRLGAFIAPFVVFSSLSEEFVGLFIAATCAVSMMAVYKLPETLNAALDAQHAHSPDKTHTHLNMNSKREHAYESLGDDIELMPHVQTSSSSSSSSEP